MCILIPLLCLIGLCFLFGYGLASLEAPLEIQGNNEIMVSVNDKITRINNLSASLDNGYQSCLEQFQQQALVLSLTTNDLLVFMDECMSTVKEEVQIDKENLFDEIKVQEAIENGFTFNWNICHEKSIDGRPYKDEQGLKFMDTWFQSYDMLYNEILVNEEGTLLTESEAQSIAMSQADGSNNQCVVNTVGGAIYWFTIMTTIGYGNASVVSLGGRILVFIFGVSSILFFSTLIGHAGFIMLKIVDHYFNRVGLKRLTEGIVAVIFWLVVLVLWLNIIAAFYILAINLIYEEERSLIDIYWFDSIWFAYISTTTIGFGDYYIPHEVVTPKDVFIVPLFLLIGFVLLANFLLKFTDWITKVMVLEPSNENESINKDQDQDQEIENDPKSNRMYVRNYNDDESKMKYKYDLSGKNHYDDHGDNRSNNDQSTKQKLDDDDMSFDNSEYDGTTPIYSL